MDVFISWSGEKSKKIAVALGEWLPSVIQSIKPFVSSETILKGSRWGPEIAKNLETSGYGILCLTPENLEAPWLLFEAGALSKMFGDSHVAPILIGIKRQDVKTPLSQFQSVVFERDEYLKLVKSLNVANTEEPLDDTRLLKIFLTLWPDLENVLKEVEGDFTKISKSRSAKTPPKEIREANLESIQSTLEELVLNLRSNNRLLNDPAEILPQEYLLSILRKADIPSLSRSGSHSRRSSKENRSAWNYLQSALGDMDVWFKNNDGEVAISASQYKEFKVLYTEIEEVCRHLIRKETFS
ncbi:MAG: toll/interleukin-1 receptor domain-containing protein [Alphaproteobacteria bacterium]|nr:toll/interleukin-1 receptor domain-containing protein [Alphaproteobacteria bacterium]